MKPAEIRFYFDEDVLGLARVVAQLRPDCTFPGDPGADMFKRRRAACPIAPGTKDTVWLPRVTELGWLIITRDYAIHRNLAERQAVRQSGARMIALSGEDARTKWGQLELLMMRWRRIEELVSAPGPFIYRASRSRFDRISLDAG